MRMAFAKEAFNRNISLLTNKLNFEVRKKLVRCYVWSTELFGSETWTLRIGAKVFRELQNMVPEIMEKII